MAKLSLRLWLLGLMVGAGLAAAGPSECAAQARYSTAWQQPTYTAGGKPGMGESISSSVKKGLGKLGEIVTPKPRVKSAEDPVSLATKAKPGVELHVAVARLYAESGKPAEAAEEYQKALRKAPHNLAVLLGYAQLKDRLGEPAEARRLYLQAVEAHPKEASAHNNLALFCAARGLLNESSLAFARAIQLQPKNPRYRNNFARLLVRMGRTKEAFEHLSAVHRPAVAHYNFAYLLEKHGQLQAAAQHFAIALRADSSLAPARRALQRLQRPSIQPQPPLDPAEVGSRVSNRPLRPTGRDRLQNLFRVGQPPSVGQLAPIWKPAREGAQGAQPPATDSQPNEVAPSPPRLMRLPPTLDRQPDASDAAPLPPRSRKQQPTPAAPLLPRSKKAPALQHLPRVD